MTTQQAEAVAKLLKHDKDGKIITLGWDLCDCLKTDCRGCWFPCPKCRSSKCGLKCRRNRQYIIVALYDAEHKPTIVNPAIDAYIQLQNQN